MAKRPNRNGKQDLPFMKGETVEGTAIPENNGRQNGRGKRPSNDRRDPKTGAPYNTRNFGGRNSHSTGPNREWFRIRPSIESQPMDPVVTGAAGKRNYGTYQFSEHITPAQIALNVSQPNNVSWWFTELQGGTNSLAVVRLQTVVKQIYLDLIAYIQDSRFLSTYQLSAAGDWIDFLSDISGFYCCVRGLQAFIESPSRNTAVLTVKQAIYQYRVRLEALLDQIMNWPLPPRVYEMLDSCCGLFQVEGLNVVLGNVPNAAAVPPINFANQIDLNNYISALEVRFQNVIVSPAPGTKATNYPIIKDVLRLAFPIYVPPAKEIYTSMELYDMQRYQAYNWFFTGPGTARSAPAVMSDQIGSTVLGTWGQSYGPQYMSLMRTQIMSWAVDTAVPGSQEMFGLIQWTMNKGRQAIAYRYDGSFVIDDTTIPVPFTDIIPGQENGAWIFPWAVMSSQDGSFDHDLTLWHSLLCQQTKYVAKMDDLCEDTISLVRECFSVGLR
jgi:hypothetical protein